MKVNKDLLPVKGHFFLFNAGTAPLVPYLSTYARQLGFSSATVGLIYTILPIFGLIAKPLSGIIADRFRLRKSIFIIFEVITILSFSAIYFIPSSQVTEGHTLQLDCGDGVTELKTCFASEAEVKSNRIQCKMDTLSAVTENSLCDMNCDMSSPKMWQTVCEHWHIPEYCYSLTENIQYSANVSNITMKDGCAYVSTNNVTLDGYTYKPSCHTGNGYVDVNEPCTLTCANQELSTAIGSNKGNMTCVDNLMNYRLCNTDSKLQELAKGPVNSVCNASCELEKGAPWKLMEICEGWDADEAKTCQPQGNLLPKNLSFVGTIKPWTAQSLLQCVYIELNHIKLHDNSTHYPVCIGKSQYQVGYEQFHSSCKITCDNVVVNELLQAAAESGNPEGSSWNTEFWLFFLFMALSWIGMAVVVTFADAICFTLLGDNVSSYGKQRLWGSLGWGIFSLLTGTLIDVFSEGTYKDYTVAFILMFLFMVGDIIVSYFVKAESTKMSMNILADVGTLISSLPTFTFMLWTIVVGLCTGLLWNFLFWHLEDIAALSCDGSDYTKTLQGLVSAVQTFGSEIPFMFISGNILNRLGHVNMMSLVLFAFGVRFILYSFLTNAWWVLPIELLQGITFGMFYPTMTSYASVVSPPGTETTVQGLVGAIFEGVGTSVGSLVGGRLYDTYGGKNTFQWFGIGSLAFCIIHIIVQYFIQKKHPHAATNQGYTSVIRYEQPNDTVFILDDVNDG